MQSLGPAGPTIEGRYAITPAGGRPLFLKIFDARIAALQEHSDRVASFLAAPGVPVVLPLPGGPRRFADSYCGELFPFLNARFSRCDARNCARSERCSHRFTGRWQRSTPPRSRVPAKKCIFGSHVPQMPCLRDGRLQAIYPRKYRRRHRLPRVAALIHETPQMVHGDCNYTNVLFEEPGGRLVVIDFEESRAAWLNPMFDVAKVIERFVLVPERADAIELARSFLDAYRDGGGIVAGDLGES